MSEQRSPGVKVVESLLPRDTGVITNSVARSVIAGYLQKGPNRPTVVNSWAEFRAVFGDWRDNTHEPTSPYTYNQMVDAAYNYFSNNPRGGSSLTVLRVVNEADASAASLPVYDESVQSATEADRHVFDIHAVSPGTWGNYLRIAISVVPEDPDSEFFRGQTVSTGVKVDDQFSREFGNQNPVRFNVYVYQQTRPTSSSAELVERFTNLSLNSGDRTFIQAAINGVSRYIRVDNVKTNSALSPSEITTQAPQHLTNGRDGSTPTIDDYSSALQKLDDIQQSLTLSIPGVMDAAIQGLASEYCAERGDSFCVVGCPDLDALDDTQGTGTSVLTWAANFPSKSSFVGLYYPDIMIPDPLAGPSGLLRATSNAGAVLGAFSANDYNLGVWHTPAGTSAYIRSAAQATRRLKQQELDALNSSNAPVNVIRRINSVGTCIMGGRTLDQRQADRYVGIRRSLSYIHARLKDLTEFAIFEPNGPDLWEAVNVRLTNFLGLYYQQGGLRGAREPDAFYVVCDATNNTSATIQNGELHITVGVAVEYPAEFVIIKLTQSQGSVRVA